MTKVLCLDRLLTVVKKKKKTLGLGRHNGHQLVAAVKALAAQLCSSGPRPARYLPNHDANRVTPYFVSKAPDTTRQHDMIVDQATTYPAQAGRTSSIETRIKIYISNLERSSEHVSLQKFGFNSTAVMPMRNKNNRQKKSLKVVKTKASEHE